MTKLIVDLDAYTRPDLGRFDEPPIASDAIRLRCLLTQLLDLGVSDFLCPAEPRILEILWQLRSQRPFEVRPLLVDAARQSRALQTYGLRGFARRRLFSGGLIGAARASLDAFPRLASIARRDFVDGSLFLAALELTQFARFRPRSVFLHANSADLATANRNRRLFEGFAGLARRRGLVPGVVTNNAGWLLPLLDGWGLRLTVAAPIAASGYHMKPDRERCEESMRRSRQALIAVLPLPGRVEEQLRALLIDQVIAAPADAVSALTMLDPG